MASFNKVIMAGNLTRDPQLSYLPSGKAVCEIGMAVSNRYTGQDGQQRENVCFIDGRCFGRQAEVLNQYMSKGRPILIEGRLDLDQWETPDGQKRSKHRIFIQSFQFLGSGPGGQGGGGGGGYAGGNQQQNAPAQQGGGNYGGQNNNRQGGGYGNAPQQPPSQNEPPGQNFGPMDEPGGEDIPF